MKQYKRLPEHFERYAKYWLSLVESDAEDWQKIAEHIVPLRSAWKIVKEYPEYCIRYVLAFRFYNARQGLGQEYLAWVKRALGAARKLELRNDIIKLLLLMGLIHERYHKLREALSEYEEALSLARGSSLEGDALNNIGQVCGLMGDITGSIQCLEKALPISRSFNDTYLEALILHNIASWHGRHSQDRHTEITWLEKSLKAWECVEDPWGMATTLNRLGNAYMERGDSRDALNLYEKSLELRNQIGDKPGQWRTLNSIGLLHSRTGEHQRALACFAEAHKLTIELGDLDAQATVLSNLGVLYAKSGETKRALGCHKRALSLHRHQGDKRGEATSLNNVGLVYLNLRESRKALHLFEEALFLWEKLRHKEGKLSTLSNIGLALLDLNERQKAASCFRRSLTIARSIQDVEGEGIALNNVGLVYSALGNHPKALSFFEQALAIHSRTGNRIEEATTLTNMAISNREMNDQSIAERLEAEASRIRAEIDDAL